MSAVTFLQRTPRLGGLGDVLQYTSYMPGARLMKLAPPAADGTPTVLCCSQFAGFEELDIQSYDVAFDAKSIVFSGKLSAGDRYGLFLLTLNDANEAAGPPAQLPTDPAHDFVFPIFAPRQRIIFMTNAVVEAGTPQHEDEYERGEAAQFGSMTVMGTDTRLGPRNLSHSVFPSMLADGRVLFSRWNHLAEENAAELMIMNPDFTTLREGFGREGSGPTNSCVKGQEVSPGRLVAICTSRDRTIQSGKILDIRLGATLDGTFRQAEQFASFKDLTPLVPGGREPSDSTVGRYYDVFPIPGTATGDDLHLLVSWADGPVEEELLSAAGLSPDFGLYLYDGRRQTRLPLYNDENMWDVQPRVLAPRAAPQTIEDAAPNGISSTSTLIGSLDVRRSSLFNDLGDQGIVGVQIIEGFSGEEGFDEFSLAETEGAVFLGISPVKSDGSWAAMIPANTAVHVQPINKFGIAVQNEPVWIMGVPGGSVMCGGCHEDRSATTVIQPGVIEALATTPPNFDAPRAQRGMGPIALPPGGPTLPEFGAKSYSWEKHLQPILENAGCDNCHNGDAALMVEGKLANKQLIFTETATATAFTYTFDLRPSANAGENYGYAIGDEFISTYSPSHLGLLGYVMELGEMGIELSGGLGRNMLPQDAKSSPLFTRWLNPSQVYPSVDLTPGKRLVPNAPQHPGEFSPDTLSSFSARTLTWDEVLVFIRITDAGAQYYNKPDTLDR